MCHKVKYDTRPPSGLLHPLPILNMILEDLSMGFIERLLMSDGHEVILVVIDRLSKYGCLMGYGHFIPNKHPYMTNNVAKEFIANVVKLHGFMKSIVIDRD